MARNVDMLGAHTHQGGPTWVGADTDRVLISFSIGCDDRCPPSEPLWCVPLSEGGLCWRRLLPQSFLSQRSSLPPLVPCLLLLFLLFLRGQLPATGALGEADGARHGRDTTPSPSSVYGAICLSGEHGRDNIWALWHYRCATITYIYPPYHTVNMRKKHIYTGSS